MTYSGEVAKRDHADEVMDDVRRAQMRGTMMLDDLFRGDENAVVRDSIIATGKFVHKSSGKELRVQTRRLEDGSHEVMAIAALSRDPGRTQDYVDAVADFTPQSNPLEGWATRVKQYRQIYKTEGLINNAVNKVSALVGVGGRFKVRKAKKGKARKASEELQSALDYFCKNVNNAPEFGVVTSERGIKATIHVAARHALTEGDWVARQQWTKVKLLDTGATASLPMTLQTLPLPTLEPVEGLGGLGELWYWKPDRATLEFITKPNKVKEVQQVIDALVDNKMKTLLKKDSKVLLTSALLLHVKHRGFATEPIGESLIEPAKLGIRYSRALEAIDLVSLENVINRLTIVQVGSADPKSPYSKADVAAARAALMQSFFEDVSPSMVIVWQGDDVKIEDVGASQAVLNLSDRYIVAERKIKSALGLPDALLMGSSGTADSASWASVIGSAAQMHELANSIGMVLTTLGERIAAENGYEGVDLVWEFDRSLLADIVEERTQNRADFLLGGMSLRTLIAAAGRDPDAEFQQMCLEKGLDPASALWSEAFAPPQGLQGQSDGGVQGQGPGKTPGEGRTPEKQVTTPKKTDKKPVAP